MARSFGASVASAVATACVSRPGAPMMRGFTPTLACADNSACMPVKRPLTSVPPITLVVVAAASTPSATRTTTHTACACAAMAVRVFFRVPVVPAPASADCGLVTSTGVSSGNAAASASSAVATKPMTAVETVVMGRVPELISITRTPWWKSAGMVVTSGDAALSGLLDERDGKLLLRVGRGDIGAHGVDGERVFAVVRAGKADARQADARLPAHQGFRDAGIQPHRGGARERLVDQLHQQAAVGAAHDARTQRRGEDVRDGLAQMRRAFQRLAGGGVGADHC